MVHSEFAEAVELHREAVLVEVTQQCVFQTAHNNIHQMLGFLLCVQTECTLNTRYELFPSFSG
jgi:hypothetical protein